MGYSNQFFNAVGIQDKIKGNLNMYAKQAGIPAKRLKYFNMNNILPTGNDLKNILAASDISELYLRLKMGRLDKDTLEAVQEYASELEPILSKHEASLESPLIECQLGFQTELGKLYQGDCYKLLKSMDCDSVDLVFADPPFNLSKMYPSEMNDNLKTEKYLHWCQEWLRECARVLKPGGAIFVWNLPKWNASLTSYINGLLTFRNWIGVDIKYSMPIQSRLYPSHYSLLYYIKGDKPNVFHPDRLPMQTCPKCFNELKDYGGYKNKMNPLGINISDIWTDIPPVRHAKYKRREGSNELSLKLLDRIIEMSTNEGDIVFDPFGGSGTTYMAAELKNRRWIGCELGPLDVIEDRFNLIESEKEILEGYRAKINALFPEGIRNKREKRGLWTAESIREPKESKK